ncbi:cryptochrome/photolyase family protein [Citreimonas salinaria]|uniref:cryptochrome/photolyase family protein n=1 Tax=Citreimonas salinaria TaxID=321339 RepID=UPI0015A726D7|nr:deoxyribodipyrimidine photo-lyase [Citreimonas salinaria]
MPERSPIIVWFRRDLRLSDHAALHAAARTGRPVIAVAIRDPLVDALGAAPKWRLGEGLRVFGDALRAAGSRLILRTGDALDVLQRLAEETGARDVWWMRAYDPDSVARDKIVKAGLEARGVTAMSCAGHVLFEPWTVETGTGGFYKVYTPFWKAVRGRGVVAPLPAPSRLPAPDAWPGSERLEDWRMGRAMDRGADIVARWANVGERAAQDRLEAFLDDGIDGYHQTRDLPGVVGTSNLSENLALGEISVAQCWHAGQRARHEGRAGAETFLKELVWRDFAYHLTWHTPHLLTRNWRTEWDAFGWREEADTDEVRAWKQGRTGIAFVDAGQREMYVTGRMHNRARMIVASYLTKHLMTHWRIGQKWFEDHLIDWDPANNALGWQWAAGSGPDATPYFRVFNPVTQLDRFDRDRAYVDRWIAEGQANPPPEALSYFEAVPRRWGLDPDDAYPDPVVEPGEGRARALAAYENRAF